MPPVPTMQAGQARVNLFPCMVLVSEPIPLRKQESIGHPAQLLRKPGGFLNPSELSGKLRLSDYLPAEAIWKRRVYSG